MNPSLIGPARCGFLRTSLGVRGGVAYIRPGGARHGRGYGGYHVREDCYMGRSSMGAYKKIAGEERQMRGAFSVECPECGAPPGFACRKPKGKTQYDSHKARRERAYAQALAQALGASYRLERRGPRT